jgi:hypothetical protein
VELRRRWLVLISAGTLSEADRIGVEADGRIVVAGLVRHCLYGEDCSRSPAWRSAALPGPLESLNLGAPVEFGC